MTRTAGIPTLRTERLVLRPHRAEDFEPYAAFMASGRACHMGGPMDRERAWYEFASDAAQWPLHGHGALAVTLRGADALAGQVLVQRRPYWPEPELGWMALDGHEGRGLIFEAARTLRDWVRRSCALASLVSYIAPANARSIALAERLGAVRDDDAPLPGPDTLVYRHWGPA